MIVDADSNIQCCLLLTEIQLFCAQESATSHVFLPHFLCPAILEVTDCICKWLLSISPPCMFLMEEIEVYLMLKKSLKA